MDRLNSSEVADRVMGTKVPHAGVYKNAALLQVLRQGEEGTLGYNVAISDVRATQAYALAEIIAGDFMRHTWPGLLRQKGMTVDDSVLTEADRVEFRILNLLATNIEEGLLVDESLVPHISRASRICLQKAEHPDDRLYFSSGINVLENVITTGALNAIGQRDGVALNAALPDDKSQEYGPLIHGSAREIARRLGFEEMLYPEEA